MHNVNISLSLKKAYLEKGWQMKNLYFQEIWLKQMYGMDP